MPPAFRSTALEHSERGNTYGPHGGAGRADQSRKHAVRCREWDPVMGTVFEENCTASLIQAVCQVFEAIRKRETVSDSFRVILIMHHMIHLANRIQ